MDRKHHFLLIGHIFDIILFILRLIFTLYLSIYLTKQNPATQYLIQVITMGIGNTCGIIHNQTTEDVFYLLHEKDLSPIEHAIRGELGDEKVKGMSTKGGLKGQHKEKIKRIMNDVEGAIPLKPGRISILGLDNVDFKKYRYFTILIGYTELIVRSQKVEKAADICLQIMQDFRTRIMQKKQTEEMRAFAEGNTADDTGKCPQCDKKSDLKEYKNPIKCSQCGIRDGDIWTCHIQPLRHCYCDGCYQVLSTSKKFKMQKQAEEKKKQMKQAKSLGN